MSDPQPETNNANDQNARPVRGFQPMLVHMANHKIEVALWGTRLLTIVFTGLYLIPVFGVNPFTCYSRTLMSNAATSALRLHQRLPNVRLTREFLTILLLEDSCHYLFYSIIFLNTYPMTLVLLPVFLFAVLHASSYTLTLLDVLGRTNWWGAKLMINIVEYQQRNILRLIAFTEIFLMFFSFGMIFFGRTSIITPIIYYRFLTLRYSSRRNPYTRQMFRELRLVVEAQVSNPACPMMIRNLVCKSIVFLSRLAPPSPQ